MLLFGRVRTQSLELAAQARSLRSALASGHALEADLRHRAYHDDLTGLPNRAWIRDQLEAALTGAGSEPGGVAFCLADLDRFKRVNDTYGHVVGDLLLVAVAHRLSALVRPGDTLARVSGDEFVVLCEDLASATDVLALARRIDEAFAEPFVLGDLTLLASASVGVAYSGPGEHVGYQLVVDADGAPDEERALAIVNGMRDRRVLIAAAGPHNHSLKVRPPLPFDDADADRFVSALAETLAATRA